MIALGDQVMIYSGAAYGSCGRVVGSMPGGRWWVVLVGVSTYQVHVSDLERTKPVGLAPSANGGDK